MTSRDESITQVIAEFSHFMASARTRWARYAEEARHELRGPSLMVLQTISRNSPVNATDLAGTLDMDKAAVSRYISGLRDLGLIEATPSAEDRRVVLLSLSAEGHTLLGEMLDRNRADYLLRFAEWSDEDIGTLCTMLSRFNECAGPAPRQLR